MHTTGYIFDNAAGVQELRGGSWKTLSGAWETANPVLLRISCAALAGKGTLRRLILSTLKGHCPGAGSYENAVCDVWMFAVNPRSLTREKWAEKAFYSGSAAAGSALGNERVQWSDISSAGSDYCAMPDTLWILLQAREGCTLEHAEGESYGGIIRARYPDLTLTAPAVVTTGVTLDVTGSFISEYSAPFSVTVGGSGTMPGTLRVKYGNTQLFSNAYSADGNIAVPCGFAWFETAGVYAPSMSATITVQDDAPDGLSVEQAYPLRSAQAQLTVMAGDEMRPIISFDGIEGKLTLPFDGGTSDPFSGVVIEGHSYIRVTARIARLTSMSWPLRGQCFILPNGEDYTLWDKVGNTQTGVSVDYKGAQGIGNAEIWRGISPPCPNGGTCTLRAALGAVEGQLLEGTGQFELVTVPYSPPALSGIVVDRGRVENNAFIVDQGGTRCRVKGLAAITDAGPLSGNALIVRTARVLPDGSAQTIPFNGNYQRLNTSNVMTDPSKSYVVEFVLQDKISAPVVRRVRVAGEMHDFAIRPGSNGTHVGIGRLPTIENGKSSIQMPEGADVLLDGHSILNFTGVREKAEWFTSEEYNPGFLTEDHALKVRTVRIDNKDYPVQDLLKINLSEPKAACNETMLVKVMQARWYTTNVPKVLVESRYGGTAPDQTYTGQNPDMVAIREVTLTPAGALVKMFEIWPVCGRVWSNFGRYETVDGQETVTWKGWKYLTPSFSETWKRSDDPVSSESEEETT